MLKDQKLQVIIKDKIPFLQRLLCHDKSNGYIEFIVVFFSVFVLHPEQNKNKCIL